MADRYEDQYRRDRGYRGDRNDRGFMERAGDEVRSWFGDDEAERRRQMDDRDRGHFRDRDFGGPSGSRSGWYDDRRYGQSSERYGQGGRDYQSSDYGSGGYGGGSYGSSSYGSGGYGSGGYGSGYGYTASDRGQFDTSDRSYGYGGRGYERTQGDPFRGGSDYRTGYGGGSSWSQRDDRGATGWFSGRGPKGYQRSDARINEEVCDRLCDSPEVDATEVEITVANGEVTLTGSVSDRNQKRRAEDLVEQISGVREVHNNLRVNSGEQAWRGGAAGDTASITNRAGGTMAAGTSGVTATAGTGNVTGEQPGNVLGVGGGAPDKASSAGAGRR